MSFNFKSNSTNSSIFSAMYHFYYEENGTFYEAETYRATDVNGTMVRLEHPIAFMSKSLTKTERNWTTIEEECYAIVHTLRKYENLLHNVKFTLKTDHANLLYMNIPPSSKVLRWKLAIREYDTIYIIFLAQMILPQTRFQN